jgi:hypothetical protein
MSCDLWYLSIIKKNYCMHEGHIILQTDAFLISYDAAFYLNCFPITIYIYRIKIIHGSYYIIL